MNVDDWTRLVAPQLQLVMHELWLVDWVLCHPAPTGQVDLDWHMHWKDVRRSVWAALHRIDLARQETEHKRERFDPQSCCQTLDITMDDAEVLLALVPTTFLWGPGPDWGQRLKMKLYRYISGEEDYHAPAPESPTKTEGAAKSDATTGTVASTGEVLSYTD